MVVTYCSDLSFVSESAIVLVNQVLGEEALGPRNVARQEAGAAGFATVGQDVGSRVEDLDVVGSIENLVGGLMDLGDFADENVLLGDMIVVVAAVVEAFAGHIWTGVGFSLLSQPFFQTTIDNSDSLGTEVAEHQSYSAD